MTASDSAVHRNRLGHVKHWAVDSNDPSAGESENFTHVDNVFDANIVTSELKDGSGLHSVVIDIDLNAELVPSTTPGHFHLYIDKPMTWDQYTALLDVLMLTGLLEPGYVGASKARGFTAVRLPWVKKEPVKTSGFEPVFEDLIPGTHLAETSVRRLVDAGISTEAERQWLMNLDAAKEASGPDAWPTNKTDPF